MAAAKASTSPNREPQPPLLRPQLARAATGSFLSTGSSGGAPGGGAAGGAALDMGRPALDMGRPALRTTVTFPGVLLQGQPQGEQDLQRRLYAQQVAAYQQLQQLRGGGGGALLHPSLSRAHTGSSLTEWRATLTEAERENVRKGVKEAFRKHAPTYEDALELMMVLQEEAIYRAAPSRLDYIKEALQFSGRLAAQKARQQGEGDGNDDEESEEGATGSSGEKEDEEQEEEEQEPEPAKKKEAPPASAASSSSRPRRGAAAGDDNKKREAASTDGAAAAAGAEAPTNKRTRRR